MQKTQTFQPKNPLANYMRQPKIYIRLPSQGAYWPDKSIEIPENGELPVFSMTARDELAFKTPDALLNGQAIVDVIQSCVPAIKNAWDCPTLDFDSILIAIRLATYGEMMTVTAKVPVANEEVDYEIDLRTILDRQLSSSKWIEQVVISPELIVFVRPLTYRHMTKTSLQSFETNKLIRIANDDKLSEEQKLEIFNSSFNMLTQITVDLMAESIFKIVTPDGEVTDKKFILEFVNNIDKTLFDQINDHLLSLKANNDLQPVEFSTTQEQQDLGAPEKFSKTIGFNESDFFG